MRRQSRRRRRWAGWDCAWLMRSASPPMCGGGWRGWFNDEWGLLRRFAARNDRGLLHLPAQVLLVGGVLQQAVVPFAQMRNLRALEVHVEPAMQMRTPRHVCLNDPAATEIG